MTRGRAIISTGLFVALLTGVILTWSVTSLITSLGALFSVVALHTEPNMEPVINSEPIGNSASLLVKASSNDHSKTGRYETIDETIARIKRDVHVTGTLMTTAGQEVAFFQIEGLPDRSFKINTQLMDGFIIKVITNNHVVLKNQIGDETFSLNVGSKTGAES